MRHEIREVLDVVRATITQRDSVPVKPGKLTPNPSVNRTRRFMATTWRASARRAGCLYSLGLLSMRRSAQALLGLTLISTTAFAQVEDKVSIRYLPGYPLPSRSNESVDVRVERRSPPARVGDQDIDRFFSLVQATLSEYRIVRDWQFLIPDAPSIEITVDMNGRRTRLISAHVPIERSGNSVVVTEHGAEALNQRSREAVLSQQSEEFRRHRLAFDKLLELSLERARIRLSP